MFQLINQYVCLLLQVYATYLIFQFVFKVNYDFMKQIDFEITTFKETCYLNIITFIKNNGTETFLLKANISNFSREYLMNLIDLSYINRVKY